MLMDCFEQENHHCALIIKEAKKNKIGVFEKTKYNLPAKNLLAFVSIRANLDAIFTSWMEEDNSNIKNELGAAPDVLIHVKGENIFAENDEGIVIYDTVRQGSISRQEFGKLLVSFMVKDTKNVQKHTKMDALGVAMSFKDVMRLLKPYRTKILVIIMLATIIARSGPC